jgi:hypothetical protein
MTDRAYTVPALRLFLGLPAERPDGVRDLLVVPREPGTPIPAAGSWRLALGDWPDAWRTDPEASPRFLVMLHGLTEPFLIATVEEIDVLRWGEDDVSAPDRRVVPVIGTECQVTATVAGARLDCGVTFGWRNPEEQYAFL